MKRVVRALSSMIRRNADCASPVIRSASSSITTFQLGIVLSQTKRATILLIFLEYEKFRLDGSYPPETPTTVRAQDLIFSRTTAMPVIKTCKSRLSPAAGQYNSNETLGWPHNWYQQGSSWTLHHFISVYLGHRMR